MDTHGNLVAWLYLEALLLLPAIVGMVGFLLRKWAIRTFGTLPLGVYQAAVPYTFTGAVAGGVVGYGVSDAFRADFLPGMVYVLLALVIVFYAGGLAAKELAEVEDAAADPFSVEGWRWDLDYLRGLRRISRADRQAFEERARELEIHGEQLRELARQHRFRVYWRSRRRRVRVFAWVVVAFGGYVAVKVALLMHSPWYLASSPTGFSMILLVWFEWRQERMVKSAEGSDQIAASKKILRELRRLPDMPVPSLRQRMAMLISPGSAIPG
jgi:hypothetical protein